MLGESGEKDAEDEEEEEEEEDAVLGAVERPSAFDLPSFVNEVKLDYTNGDVYKVRYTFSGCVGEFVSLPQQEGFGVLIRQQLSDHKTDLSRQSREKL